jgi:hypothetical protein
VANIAKLPANKKPRGSAIAKRAGATFLRSCVPDQNGLSYHGNPRARKLAGAPADISFAFGLFLVYDIGFADGGLFTDNPNGQPH